MTGWCHIPFEALKFEYPSTNGVWHHPVINHMIQLEDMDPFQRHENFLPPLFTKILGVLQSVMVLEEVHHQGESMERQPEGLCNSGRIVLQLLAPLPIERPEELSQLLPRFWNKLKSPATSWPERQGDKCDGKGLLKDAPDRGDARGSLVMVQCRSQCHWVNRLFIRVLSQKIIPHE